MADQPQKNTILYKILCFIPLVLLLTGAALFPFYYETTTLWYKFGSDKVYLRAGQIAGLLAFSLLLLQVVLAVRGRLLERVFGSASLLRYHRINGGLVSVLAVTHVVLILEAERLDEAPIGLEYWPEMIGVATFVVLILSVTIAYLRNVLKLYYAVWRRLHRTAGVLLVIAAGLHLFFVSDAFEQLIPGIILAVLLLTLLSWVVAVKWFSRR
jgi:predicted ferric reductase